MDPAWLGPVSSAGKKLSLSKLTLRTLSSSQLRGIRGALETKKTDKKVTDQYDGCEIQTFVPSLCGNFTATDPLIAPLCGPTYDAACPNDSPGL
jgi:hypothetical protein